MKRFGVRIAAGAVTILLGVLAAVQAQRGTADSSDTSWSAPDSLALQSPPQPIGGSTFSENGWASEIDQSFPGGPSDNRPSYGEVQMVSHDEPIDNAPTGTPATTFAMGPASFSGPGEVASESTPPAQVEPVEAPMSFGVADLPQLPGPNENEDVAPAGNTFAMGPVEPTDAPAISEITMPALDMSFGGGPVDTPTESAPQPEVNAAPAGPANDLRGGDNVAAFGAPPATQFGVNKDLRTQDVRSEDAPVPSSFGAGSTFATQPTQPQTIQPQTNSLQPAVTGMALPEPAALPSIQTPAPAAAMPETNHYGQSQMPPPINQVASATVRPLETISTPGDRRLDGVQSPSVLIQKRAPSEVKVGKPASFTIQVQNVGSAEALDVQVHDSVPQGMRFIEASPQPQADRQGNLVWALGALEPGGERTVTMQLVPEQEGELGSVARVTFEAAASVRTISTRPQLEVVQRAPEQVLIGQQAEIEIEIRNPGSGVASGVIVQEDVPQQFEHPYGRELDKPIGDLQPGETRVEVLRMRAVAPGMVQNTLRVVGDDGLEAVHVVNVEVVAPEIQVQLAGPARRFLERQATYQVNFANTGTATANNVQFVAQLDRGFKFVSAENQGFYDPTAHTVTWQLAHLNAGQEGNSLMTLLPIEPGDQVIRLEAASELTETVVHEVAVAIDSLAELTFQIADTADPIEVGGETTYELRVRNAGSRNDGNVMVQFQLPPGLQLLGTDLDSNNDGRGNVVFSPAPNLAAGEELVYRVRVRGDVAGNHLIKAIVQSNESEVPVTKEESTKVYSDR